MLKKILSWFGSRSAEPVRTTQVNELDRIHEEIQDRWELFDKEYASLSKPTDDSTEKPDTPERSIVRKERIDEFFNDLDSFALRIGEFEQSADRDEILKYVENIRIQYRQVEAVLEETIKVQKRLTEARENFHVQRKEAQRNKQTAIYNEAESVYMFARKHGLNPEWTLQDFANKSDGLFDYEKDFKPLLLLFRRGEKGKIEKGEENASVEGKKRTLN